MFDGDYDWQASHIEDLQEEQIAWMAARNGIFFGEDDDETVQCVGEDDESQYVGFDDEPPTFQRVDEHEDDGGENSEPDLASFRLKVQAWLRR